MSQELRQYLAVLIVGALGSAVTLALLALGALLRPARRTATRPVVSAAAAGVDATSTEPAWPRSPDRSGVEMPPSGASGSIGARWSLARTTVVLGACCVLLPVVLSADSSGVRAAAAVLGASCVTGVAAWLLSTPRSR